MSSMAAISKSLELSLLEFLPPEVLSIISRDLSKRDLKERTIADHEVYRYQVKEII